MRVLVSSGGVNSIGFRAVYSIDRIRQSAERWTGSRSVPEAARQRCQYWESRLATAETIDMIREQLRAAYEAAHQPMLIASVYPVPGPAARVGGQAFLADSSVEVWCGQLDPVDVAAVTGTVAHELAHLMLMPLVHKAMDTIEDTTESVTIVCELLCGAYTGFPQCSGHERGPEAVLAAASLLLGRTTNLKGDMTPNALVRAACHSLKLARIHVKHKEQSHGCH